ncbi:hypothetical protein [Crenobacter cavernae]|uniref:Uncharacterized protein n=1 Tax=Crenobacter cavernae TaxID=2290923 RepID=A0A345Y3H7_9NEIS|nr:hypothetical protein [Crenobacter cavernae]AXK38479.1 hypothetical protein DWG20_03020 [Crenobacter cavernae]
MARETAGAFWARWRLQRKKGPLAFIARKGLIYMAIALPVGYLYDVARGKPLNPDPVYHLMNVSSLAALIAILCYIGWRFNEARFKGLDEEARSKGYDKDGEV